MSGWILLGLTSVTSAVPMPFRSGRTAVAVGVPYRVGGGVRPDERRDRRHLRAREPQFQQARAVGVVVVVVREPSGEFRGGAGAAHPQTLRGTETASDHGDVHRAEL